MNTRQEQTFGYFWPKLVRAGATSLAIRSHGTANSSSHTAPAVCLRPNDCSPIEHRPGARLSNPSLAPVVHAIAVACFFAVSGGGIFTLSRSACADLLSATFCARRATTATRARRALSNLETCHVSG